jgi:hypothetical protein
MKTLELKLNIDEALLAQAGEASLKAYLHRAADAFRTQLLADKLREAVGGEEQMDADFETAKREAWDEYKTSHLPGHLREVVERREVKP